MKSKLLKAILKVATYLHFFLSLPLLPLWLMPLAVLFVAEKFVHGFARTWDFIFSCIIDKEIVEGLAR